MTSEELANRLDAARHTAKRVRAAVAARWPSYIEELAEVYLALVEPEWKDAPDSDGFWWLLLGTQFPILVFVEPGMAHYVRDTKRYRIDLGHERKYAKAIVPQGPNRKD